MPTLAEATKPRDTSNLVNVTPSSAPAFPARLPNPEPQDDPGWSALSLGPIPQVLGSAPDYQRQFYRKGTPQIRTAPLPAAASIAAGAQAASQIILEQNLSQGVTLKTNGINNPNQAIENLIAGSGITLAVDSQGGTTITGTSTGDGLVHGATIWETDPGYNWLRDDFIGYGAGSSSQSGTSIGSNPFGQFGWTFISGASASGFIIGASPNMGYVHVDNNSSPSNCSIFWANTNNSAGTGPSNVVQWPLLDNPPWALTFIWKVESASTESNYPAFTMAKKSLYIGLGQWSLTQPAAYNTISARPNTFLGIRFDKDPGTSFVLTQVQAGTPVAGQATYLGTFTGGASNAFLGNTISVTGFGTAGNNTGGVNPATFTIISSSSTQVVVANGNAGNETHAGTATTPSINDSFYTFEGVTNLINAGPAAGRNNTQGNVFVTTLAPADDGFHRLDIVCTVRGQVTMTLDGSSTNTSTISMPLWTISNGGKSLATSQSFSGLISHNFGQVSWNGPMDGPGAPGALVTVSGVTTVNYTALNVTNAVMKYAPQGGGSAVFAVSAADQTNTSLNASGITISGYPTLIPFWSFGNDSEAAPAASIVRFGMDFVAYIWNPGVGGGTGTPVSTKSRYF